MAISIPQLRGYLLEEALAWLMRHSGYNLLVDEDQDPDELLTQGSELRVRGRGTSHQVDVLGEFAFTPAFSLPVRLFLEAKHYQRRCGLDVVRNAHGVLADVNQNYVASAGGRPRRRFQYCYALFSASGFSSEAEAFAIAHQISLIDLATPSFEWLLDAVAVCATELYDSAEAQHLPSFPLKQARHELRRLLGSAPIETGVGMAGEARRTFLPTLEKFRGLLQRHSELELLIGFPPAPFILPLIANDRRAFISYAERHPSHAVSIRRQTLRGTVEWIAVPVADDSVYRLSFSLPSGIEEWIAENEKRRRDRTWTIKNNFLATITIYFDIEDELRVCYLRYEPGALTSRQ